ncbi:hypothetical protein [Cytobacillus kochii]|uniref:hypothetical protein n=1 Tax=Cytobacillus kochii TaxID=859143 RepID=UPI00402B018E
MPENKIPEGWESLINRLEKRGGGADWSKPAESYSNFLATAEKLFIAKDTDYDSRYLRGIIALDARTIWTWEVGKKLDRLRSWIKRGELQVKGEGIRNSVDDLFIYTVQYYAYVQRVINYKHTPASFLENVRKNRASFFEYYASRLTVNEWTEFLEAKGLIGPNELLLKHIIHSYMGERVNVEDWKAAIKSILS